jgi:hypothetical protein
MPIDVRCARASVRARVVYKLARMAWALMASGEHYRESVALAK